MLYVIGIVISMFLSFLLLLKQKNKADWVLLFWLLALSIHTSLFYVEVSEHLENYGYLIGLIIPFPLLHGPFLYSYTRLILYPQRKSKNLFLHFLPFVLINLCLINFYFLPTEEKLYVFNNDGIGYESFVLLNSVLVVLSGAIYAIWSYLLIRKHQKKVKNNFSQTEGINFKWLSFLAIGLGSIWVVVFLGNASLIFSGVVLFIILIGIFGVRQTTIFSDHPVYHIAASNEPPTYNKKYSNSGLTAAKKKEIIHQLAILMEKEKPYLDTELSLQNLAQQLNEPPNYLSQVLNEHFDMNFYDYINSKRIEEFCKKVFETTYENYKLTEIAYECGFNSKSSFNRNFKRFKQQTPSAYRKTGPTNVLSDKMTP